MVYINNHHVVIATERDAQIMRLLNSVYASLLAGTNGWQVHLETLSMLVSPEEYQHICVLVQAQRNTRLPVVYQGGYPGVSTPCIS